MIGVKSITSEQTVFQVGPAVTFQIQIIFFEILSPNCLFNGSVNPDIVKNIACCNFLNCDVYKNIHFWYGNESENPFNFLISNFTKNAVFFEKMAKNHFFWLKTL